MTSLLARPVAAPVVGLALALAACTGGAQPASSGPASPGSQPPDPSPSNPGPAATPSPSAAATPTDGAGTDPAATPTRRPTTTPTRRPTATPAGPQNQTITFQQPPDQVFAENLRIGLVATASSGLPVTFVLIDDNGCRLEGATVVVQSQGTCGIEARQAGNTLFRPAPPVRRSFSIQSARGIFTWSGALPDRQLSDTEFEIRADIELGLSVEFFSQTPGVCDANVTERAPDHTTAVVLLFGTGTCTITAEQNESQNYFAGDPIARSFQVLPASPAP